MLNSQDIYSHLLNGGEIKDLYVALDKEIAEANKKIKAVKEAEQKEKELAEKIKKARPHAIQVLKNYFAFVNPDVTEDIIASVLDTLESVEIKVNGVRGKRVDSGVLEQTIDLTDEEWKEVWNTVFPFHFKRK